jgi:hypothetical protein
MDCSRIQNPALAQTPDMWCHFSAGSGTGLAIRHQILQRSETSPGAGFEPLIPEGLSPWPDNRNLRR